MRENKLAIEAKIHKFRVAVIKKTFIINVSIQINNMFLPKQQ